MSVQEKMGSGAAWMTVVMVIDRVIGLVSVLVLARLLVPEDFGVVAMCMSVVAGLQLFTAFGFEVVLIQDQQATRDHYNTVFTLNVLFGVAFGICVAALSGVTANYYSEPRVVLPMMLLGVGFLVKSFENIKVVDFRKDLEFRKEAILRVSQKVAGFAVTVPLAFYLESYWALVIGMLWMHGFSVILSYAMKPFLPRFTLAKAREIFSFSGWLFLSNALMFLHTKFADFLIGSRLGASSLGVLNMSTELASTPATQLIASVNRAMFPGYAKLAEKPAELASTYLSVLCAISLVAVPIGLGIASVAELIVPVVLGDKWLAASPLIAIFGIYSAIVVLEGNTTYVFYALGIPRQVTYYSLSYVVILIPTMYFLVTTMGVVGGAWGFLVTSIVSLPIIFFMVQRKLPVTTFAIVRALWRSVGSGVIMFFSVKYFLQLPIGLPDALMLIAAISVGAVTYAATLLFLIVATGFREVKEWGLITDAYGMALSKLQRQPA